MSYYCLVKQVVKTKFKTKSLRSRKNISILFFITLLGIAFSTAQMGIGQKYYYAEAYTKPTDDTKEFKLVMSGSTREVLSSSVGNASNAVLQKKAPENISGGQLQKRLYEIVAEAPIKEMIPFIAKRDQLTAAFLIGIAKKESSFGLASPSKEGKTCYNYWGYKGSGSRGVGMGYACFGSPEEAVEIVGNRIAELVAKKRNTPERMVDTWKCGTSCSGDKGAPGWVSTVAMYFEKIVEREV